jgi:hypothetical protein
MFSFFSNFFKKKSPPPITQYKQKQSLQEISPPPEESPEKSLQEESLQEKSPEESQQEKSQQEKSPEESLQEKSPEESLQEESPLEESLPEDSSEIKVLSWNVEDFITLYKYTDNIYDILQQQDILMIQEWNNKTNVNNEFFMKNINKNGKKRYDVISVDRVAVVYNTYKFEEIPIDNEIPLAHEPPSLFEPHTTGRQKSNILVMLREKNTQMPIGVIVCHLSAYSPKLHPKFHAKQFTKLLADSIYRIRKLNESYLQNLKIIMGGDTNYRQHSNFNNLLRILIFHTLILIVKGKNKL